MAQVNRARALLLSCLLWAAGPAAPAAAAAGTAAPTENQLKAVFIFNFSHFVQWPPAMFAAPAAPFVICVLGSDALAAELDATVRGEQVDQHPLAVRRFSTPGDFGDCHILFIDRSMGAQLDRILAPLKEQGTLTVSDQDGAARRGAMIQFATQQRRIRLLINVEAARTAGLTISSNLLRPAEIVGNGD